ncbi:hypothetical protein SAMN05216249_1041 [Acetitomaculum ruminis DSM 5522]|uniref:Uncharacterized protein n=1 Tax=Acetitomaculum ruminis DSM 5522 TaxID=1120918 RepID=A0A1I0WCP1_9FIRM|nr:hypothetical protein [Acetitomaculum ruminis]SFA86482.1 hypothetical protein SAMN05216249_1041 [Acetitomaculum ruminis DSM 5522]
MCDEENTVGCNHDIEENCASCSDGDGKGGCTHSHLHSNTGGLELTLEQYLQLTYKQNQMIAAKLEKYSDDLTKAGKADVAVHLKNSIMEFEKGNMWLGVALSMLN